MRGISHPDWHAVFVVLRGVAQHLLQDSVHDQIRIAANRRCEVRVRWRGQREVAFVLLRVARLLQRAQHQVRQDALLRLARDLLRQLLIHARRDVDVFRDLQRLGALSGAGAFAPLGLELHPLDRQRADAQRIAETRGDGLEVHHALGIGLLVDAIQRRDALVLEIAGDALVGRQHELLDDAVGDVALRARDAGHQAVLVELDHRLGQIEVDGAAAHALAVEDQRQLAHQLEDVDQPAVVLAQRGIAFEDEVDVGIGHALGGADDALAQRVADDLALVVDLHHARQHHAIDLRTQAAHVGGELDGKHGHGAIGKVDRGAAQARLEIDGRLLANVVGDVGDVDLELEVAVRTCGAR